MTLKRQRSDGNEIIMQSKMFVNENLVNSKDENKMKKIYDKTLNLLFQAAKRHEETCLNSREKFKTVHFNGNGVFRVQGDKPNWIPETSDRSCKICQKSSVIHADCTNCNLELCEFCGFSCVICKEPVCSTCVNLFNCGTIDNPCCEKCKVYEEL